MTAPIASKFSIGFVLDELLSAAYTMYWGRKALLGLSKLSCVAQRADNQLLKLFYFDTDRADSWGNRVISYVPEGIKQFFRDDSGYNDYKVPPSISRDAEGNERIIGGEYKHSFGELLVSGLTLSLTALAALELKQAFWRPVHPFLNGILSYISPIRLVLGHSWVANGINAVAGAPRA